MLWSAVASLLVASPAHAHIIATRLGDFYTGGLHPLSGLEDGALWLGLAVLAGSQPGRQGRYVLLAFPLSLLAGLAGAVWWALPPVPAIGDAAAMVVLGGLIASGIVLPRMIVVGLTVAVGVWRGAANATGIGPATDLLLFAGGFVLTGYVVVTLTAAIAVAVLRGSAPWRMIAVRAWGSWLAAIGLMFGSYVLAGVKHIIQLT